MVLGRHRTHPVGQTIALRGLLCFAKVRPPDRRQRNDRLSYSHVKNSSEPAESHDWLPHRAPLLSHAQVTMNVPRREDPGGMALVPAHGSGADQPPGVVQQKIAAERQSGFHDIECYCRSREGSEIPAAEVFEAGNRQVPPMRGVLKGIVRAKMWSDNPYIGAVLADAMYFRHSLHGILEMFDDVRHEDAGKAVAFERPRVPVQVPNDVGG
jgi:hypothetical protein